MVLFWQRWLGVATATGCGDRSTHSFGWHCAQVYGLPTLVLFRDGKEVEGSKREGAIAKAGIISWMEGHGVSK